MFLKKIELFNFKSYEDLNLQFKDGLNIIVGLNGTGKTNILEAIYFLSLTKPFSGLADAQLVKDNGDMYVVKGSFDTNEVAVSYKLGSKKTFLLDRVPYKKNSDHVGKFPVVFVSPNDHDYIRDASETRRRFFDELFSQTYPEYLEALIHYTKLLKQRNQLLKQFKEQNYFDEDLLIVFDEKMCAPHELIRKYRVRGAKEMSVYTRTFYNSIAENVETVGINYKDELSDGEYLTCMKQYRSKDRMLGRTNFGVHKDDYEFVIEDKSLKKYGSQGQQKTFMLATQLGKFKYIKDNADKMPILLLDDVFDKLDQNRILALLNVIESGIIEQCFITDASKERTLNFVKQMKRKPSIFEIAQGKVSEI